MKLWRKLAKKEANGKRNGREIRYNMFMMETLTKKMRKSTTLLDVLFERAGIVVPKGPVQIEVPNAAE